MKKTIALLLGLAFLLPLNSCFKEEEDLFPESPAQRLNKLSKEYKELLCGAENGWVMQYFANETEQSYPILMKFGASGGVTMASKNSTTTSDAYKEEASTYSIIQDMSVVLSFDTYNSLLHPFADPMSDGIGHGGDYEFQIVSVSEDAQIVNMKGKKSGLSIRLIKVPTDLKWEDYYTQIAAKHNEVLPSKLKVAYLVSGDKFYTITGLSSGILTFLPQGGDPETDSDTYSMSMRLDGSVQLSSPYSGLNGEIKPVQNFVLAENGSLVCVDKDSEAVITTNPLSVYFTDANNKWRINRDTYDDAMKALDASMALGMEKEGYGKLTYVQLFYNSSVDVMVLAVKTKSIEAHCYFTYAKNGDNGVSLQFDLAKMRESNTRQVKNAVAIYDTSESFKQYVEALSGEYSLTSGSALATTQMQLAGSHSFAVDLQ